MTSSHRLPIKWFAAFVLIVGWNRCAVAQTQLNTEKIDAAVVAEMRRQGIVGAAVGVIQDGKLAYAKGYGFADLEKRVPATEKTVFNWASNSKPVMAVAAMQLVEAGKLDLDTSIRKYIPSLPIHWKDVTTRHLLCHQSGIPHYSNGRVVSSGKTFKPEQELDPLNAVHRFVMSPLLFKPGERREYSSYAYVLLSAVVQAAGKEEINAQLLNRIGKPLELSSFQLDLPYDGQPNWTTGYKLVAGRPVAISDTAHFWKHGAGGYKSDVTDFAKFAIGLMNHDLMKAETAEEMWTPQELSDGKTSDYGLGVVVSKDGDVLKISHNGAQDETRTRMVIYPAAGHGMVVMCNTADVDPGAISTAIYRAIKE